jgi:hypothetical protein
LTIELNAITLFGSLIRLFAIIYCPINFFLIYVENSLKTNLYIEIALFRNRLNISEHKSYTIIISLYYITRI